MTAKPTPYSRGKETGILMQGGKRSRLERMVLPPPGGANCVTQLLRCCAYKLAENSQMTLSLIRDDPTP